MAPTFGIFVASEAGDGNDWITALLLSRNGTMASLMYVWTSLVEEWLGSEWATYGLAERRRFSKKRTTGTPEEVNILKRITSKLFEGDDSMKAQAIRDLEEWLAQNPEHPESPVLRLRLALYLHKMKRYAQSLSHVDQLLAIDSESAALLCIKGNIHQYLAKTSKRDEELNKSLEAFKAAIKCDGEWLEPILELIECLFKAENWPEALDYAAAQGLQTTPREYFVLLAYKCVAELASRQIDPESSEFKNRVVALEQFELKSVAEYWHVDSLWKDYLSRSKNFDDSVRSAIHQVLAVVDQKLHDPSEPDRRLPPFR